MRRVDNIVVSVGINREEGADRDNRGVSVAQEAIWSEYGTKNSPPRPFMRTTYNANQSFAGDQVRSILRQIPQGGNAIALITAFGNAYRDRIKGMIKGSASWAVPNSPLTIKRKGSSTPLIDTRRMLNAVKARIRRGK